MASYWVVVKKGKRDLLNALSSAFSRHEGFTVIEDRRKDPMRRASPGTAGKSPGWNGDDFIVVERGSLVD